VGQRSCFCRARQGTPACPRVWLTLLHTYRPQNCSSTLSNHQPSPLFLTALYCSSSSLRRVRHILTCSRGAAGGTLRQHRWHRCSNRTIVGTVRYKSSRRRRNAAGQRQSGCKATSLPP